MISTSPAESAVDHATYRNTPGGSTRVAVIWIDWYAYHVARLQALARHPFLEKQVVGIELVGRAGVHGELVFRIEEREGLQVETLMPHCGWAEAGQVRLARKLWTKLDELDPEVILVPGYYTLPALAAVLWARRRNKKAILMSESTRQDHRRRPYVERIKRAVVRRLFHAAIAGGTRQAAYLKDLGFCESDIARLYDVVDNDYFAQQSDHCLNQQLLEPANLPKRYFLYVGRLAPEKNIDGLIRAFARYRECGGLWSLVIVGGGPLEQDLQQQVLAKGLSSYVHFEGLKNTRDIVVYYAFAQWFILPSWREPWGLVVNEAMASGLPVLLSDRCGCSDDLLEQGGNGYVFDPTQEEALVRLLLRISKLTEEQRQRMGRRSREIISHYAPHLWAEEVVRIAGITSIASSTAA